MSRKRIPTHIRLMADEWNLNVKRKICAAVFPHGLLVHEPHVIALCSPETFSAAYHFMYFLMQIGKTTVVGVPSRQAGNTFMENTNFELPNTKMEGSISNGVQIFFPNDPCKGKIPMPDFAMQWQDYAKYDFDPNAEILYALDLIENNEI